MGIDHRVASAYHPKTGGHTERFNRTLCTMLGSVVNDQNNNWDEQIPHVLFAYRTAEHASTKTDPFSLVYGREARLPIELDLPVDSNSENNDDALKRRAEAFLRLSTSRKTAKKNIRNAQKKQKQYHDAHITDELFDKGDRVLLHNSRRNTRMGGKLEKRWSGSYKIVNVIFQQGSSRVYKLEGVKGTINGNRLKKYRDREYNEEKTESNQSRQNKHNSPLRNSKDNVTYHEKNIPFKNRKYSHLSAKETVEDDDSDDTVSYTYIKPKEKILFKPIDRNWQVEKAEMFGIHVKNCHKPGNPREMVANAKPNLVIPMRGDGNCLFRAFSYIVFGVQSFHVLVRDYILDYMRTNASKFTSIEPRGVRNYIRESSMDNVGTWGSEVEIFAFATMLNTDIYVYCKQGTEGKTAKWGWSRYYALDGTPNSESCIYLQNVCAHFEPVFGVDFDETDREFIKRPYFEIKHYLSLKNQQYLTAEISNAALVDNRTDEAILHNHGYKNVIVKQYSDTPYSIENAEDIAREIDPNIFNVLCDFCNLEDNVNKKSKY